MWGYSLILFLIASGIFDIRGRRIPNWLVVAGGVLALISLFLGRDVQPLGLSWDSVLVGSISIFLVFLFFYKLGYMGAGDVKFSAVLGLWVGWQLLIQIWIISCLFALFHGIFSRSQLKYFIANWIDIDAEVKGKKFIPYVTYLALATIIIFVFDK